MALAKLGAMVTGIDLGEDLVVVAKRIAALNHVQCEFITGSIDDVPFADNTFHFVVGNAILHHLPREGVVKALHEALRVLRPGGMALFTEPVENSRIFDFMQNLIPVGRRGMPRYRPSILQRAAWRAYQERADDRALSNAELMHAGAPFRKVRFQYFGLSVRLNRLLPSSSLRRMLEAIDVVLTHRMSPVKLLAQTALVIYTK